MVFKNNKWAFWFLNYNKPYATSKFKNNKYSSSLFCSVKSHAISNQKKRSRLCFFFRRECRLAFWGHKLGQAPLSGPIKGMRHSLPLSVSRTGYAAFFSLVMTIFLDIVVFFFKSSAKRVFTAFAVITIGGNIIKRTTFTININTIRVGE